MRKWAFVVLTAFSMIMAATGIARAAKLEWVAAGQYSGLLASPPDGIRYPATIRLLKEQALYSVPYSTAPIGHIAPQEVQVVKAERDWNRSGWFQIHTWLGDVWVEPNISEYTVPPPATITLFQDTELYADKNPDSAPIGKLTAQAVTVTDADLDWFSPYRMHWVKVRTSAGAEGWLYLPLHYIGVVKPTSARFYVWNGGAYNDPYFSPMPCPCEGVGPVVAPVMNEFQNVEYSAYEIETPSGRRWIQDTATIVEPLDRSIELKAPALAFRLPGHEQDADQTLQPQTVKAYESVDVGDREPWVHVHADLGDFWINAKYTEPEGAAAVSETLQLDNTAELYYYPDNQGVKFAYIKIAPQPVHVTKKWKSPHEPASWYQIDSYLGKAWIRVVEIKEPMPLYLSHPNLDSYPSFERSGDTVQPGNYVPTYANGWNSFAYTYKIKLPSRDGWIRYIDEHPPGYTEIRKEIAIPGETSLSWYPDEYNPDWTGNGIRLAPQTVTATAQWKRPYDTFTTWYRIETTFLGPAWIQLSD